jgi:hypothetical protein
MNPTKDNQPTLAWQTHLAHPPTALALLDDVLLVAAYQRPENITTLQALALSDGRIRWQKTFARQQGIGLAAGLKLAVVVLTSEDFLAGAGRVLALNISGREQWHWQSEEGQLSLPVVEGGRLFVPLHSQALVCLDLASGRESDWINLPRGVAPASVVVGGERLFLPCRRPRQVAISVGGREQWQFDSSEWGQGWLHQPPCLVGESLYAVSSQGHVFALQQTNGELLWHSQVGPPGKKLSQPAADRRRLYIGARDGLYALHLSDGTPAWHFSTGKPVEAAPLVVGETVFVAGYDRTLYALSAEDGREQWRWTANRRFEQSPLLARRPEAGRPLLIAADRGGTITTLELLDSSPAAPAVLDENIPPLRASASPRDLFSEDGTVAVERPEPPGEEGQTIPAVSFSRSDFSRLILPLLTLDDLRGICFDMNIEFDDLEGQTRKPKWFAFWEYVERRGRLFELFTLLRQHRPDLKDRLPV